MKKFIIRIINVCVIVTALFGYNKVTLAHEQADAEAKAEADRQNAEIAAQSGESGGSYKDGTYQGTATGFGGDITVEVTIADGKITDVEILSAEKEDGAYLTMAKDIIPEILDAQSADVDTISGATFSSTGIKNATAQALEEGGAK
ncbi:FMN-binding protein [uncultured Eubacterium sp.]|uniref:FMN-binding protein n=1 Tax=uncultured Eubacterium sp. TaxID=165185 RepID=UPI0025FAEE3B|nr:FMN-binding protein [uncultured Eubacterium sp.]